MADSWYLKTRRRKENQSLKGFFRKHKTFVSYNPYHINICTCICYRNVSQVLENTNFACEPMIMYFGYKPVCVLILIYQIPEINGFLKNEFAAHITFQARLSIACAIFFFIIKRSRNSDWEFLKLGITHLDLNIFD